MLGRQIAGIRYPTVVGTCCWDVQKTLYVRTVTVILKISQANDLHLKRFKTLLKMHHFMAAIRMDYK